MEKAILRKVVLDARRYDKDETTGCWNWLGAKAKSGHGIVRVGRKILLAHRAFYTFLIGPILLGLIAHHDCRNPRCVNPYHLRIVTKAEHNRIHAGENGKLSVEKVREIRRRWEAGGVTQASLAAKYRVDVSTISLVVRHRTWVFDKPDSQKAA
jgi:hypothetical protein